MRYLQLSCGLCLLLFATIVPIGCNNSVPQFTDAPDPKGPPTAPEVLIEFPQRADVTDYEEFTGRTAANTTIEIRARVSGYLERVAFGDIEGSNVEIGTLLFKIDARPYQAEVARAEANLRQAATHLKRFELDYDRARQNVGARTITEEQYDKVAGDRAEAKAQVKIMQADLELAKLNLSFCDIRAPISGRISRALVDEGNLVLADDTVLAVLMSVDPMDSYFELDERTFLRLRRSDDESKSNSTHNEKQVLVKMALADETEYLHDGVVNYFDNQLDASTGTLQARGIFSNTDRLLSPGMYVRIRLPIGDPHPALVLSERAIGTDQGQRFVYVIDDHNQVQYRRVKVGKLQKDQRVVLSGISEGERVIAGDLERWRPGGDVNPKVAGDGPVATGRASKTSAKASAVPN